MTLYTWGTARTEVLNRLGGRNDSTTTERANNWLSSAQLQFAKSHIEIPSLHQVTTQLRVVADQSEYNLTTVVPDLTDIIGIRSVRNDTSKWKMWRFPWREYREISTQAQSAPIRWARTGNL